MGIFSILSRNSAQGSRTRQPEDRVPVPGRFRGAITHAASHCIGCGTCAYVCSPSAITIGQVEGRPAEWRYFSGQCTFCGRCVEYCPTLCLGFEETVVPVTLDLATQRVSHRVEQQACPRCGQPTIPLPLATLQSLHGGELPEDLLLQQRLCERCRGKISAQRLHSGFGAAADE
jgi:formate hydrogenlyase subunit 6/NADH:ubiquinone oxidoreductase subunit I